MESRMKHFESYVAEAQARRRQRMANGIVGAVMLAALALWALLAFKTPVRVDKPRAGQVASIDVVPAAGPSATLAIPADLRADSHAALRNNAVRYH